MAQPKSETEAISFLGTLPLEIRELIYVHLYTYKRPFYQISGGQFCLNSNARNDLRLMRTCKTIYIEAIRVLHAMNSISLQYDDMRAFHRLPESSHILAGAIVVKCNSFVVEDGGGKEVENIDFGVIGRRCPLMQYLEVVTYYPGSLLWNVQKLTKSLPCSTIRTWPLLLVDVAVPMDPKLHDNGNFTNGSMTPHGIRRNLEKQVLHCTDKNDVSWLTARSAFSLGSEMPQFLKTIRVKGTLSRRLCGWIEAHASTFGDCQFEKKVLREKLQIDSVESDQAVRAAVAMEAMLFAGLPEMGREAAVFNALKDTSEEQSLRLKSDTSSYVRYTWCRNGLAIPRQEVEDNEVISGLNRWVPQLNLAWYEKMMDDGLEVEHEKLQQPGRGELSSKNHEKGS